ncbi:hypothetical protein VTO73DRAFT_14465 [Trametes versicolor]
MISMHSLYCLMQSTPGLCEAVDLATIISFTRLASSLKSAIIDEQDVDFEPTKFVPKTLPTSILVYLAQRLRLSQEHVQGLWLALGRDIWTDGATYLQEDVGLQRRDTLDIRSQLAAHMLYPPTHVCLQPQCARRTLLRRKDDLRTVTVFTLNNGVYDAFSVHLYCRTCHSNYHHNFVVQAGVRIYYGGVPDVIQVSEHKFVERRVLELFTALSLYSWTSSTNAASIYHHALSLLDPHRRAHPHYRLRTEHVMDGSVIHALLKDARDRAYVLRLPHTGAQKNRFTVAMQARNDFMNRSGQPEFTHYCTKCVRLFENADGTTGFVDVVVTDGIEIGRPCCSSRHCEEPLLSTQDRYCPSHRYLQSQCSIAGCSAAAPHGFRTCVDSRHRAVETWHNLHGKAMFNLRRTLLRARTQSTTTASFDAASDVGTGGVQGDMPELDVIAEAVEDESGDTELVIKDVAMSSDALSLPASTAAPTGLPGDVSAHPPTSAALCPDKPDVTGRSMRTMFTRRRTHNEQLLLRPCGIIIKRATFYGSETTPQVLDLVRKTFPSKELLPRVLIYDNNCQLYKHSKARGDTLHEEIGLPVDVFHWKSKHKKTDEACAVHCNPFSYPELRIDDDGNWFFNSSICEQTNVWGGGFAPILREMTGVKHDFFLDEMIKEKNAFSPLVSVRDS